MVALIIIVKTQEIIKYPSTSDWKKQITVYPYSEIFVGNK